MYTQVFTTALFNNKTLETSDCPAVKDLLNKLQDIHIIHSPCSHENRTSQIQQVKTFKELRKEKRASEKEGERKQTARLLSLMKNKATTQ